MTISTCDGTRRSDKIEAFEADQISWKRAERPLRHRCREHPAWSMLFSPNSRLLFPVPCFPWS